MAKVYRHDDEDIDSMIKRFNRQCRKDGIMDAYKKHQSYRKPGERRKSKHNIAVKFWRMRQKLHDR